MSQVLIDETNLENIASAIREKSNTTDTYTVIEMPDAIRRIAGGTDGMPIGVMVAYGFGTPPSNWLVCDGSEVSRTDYPDLFAVIGTSYGAGDGSTTFNLPNKKGKVSVGLDTSDSDFSSIGKTGGSKDTQAHYHDIRYSDPTHSGVTISCTGAGSDVLNIPGFEWNKNYNGKKGSGSNLYTSIEGTGDSGNVQPYQVDCWIIKALKDEDSGPVTLYNNSNGTTGSITLTESITNFSYLEIFYYTGSQTKSVRYDIANGKGLELMVMSYDTSNSSNIGHVMNVRIVNISGTTISNHYYRRIYFYPSLDKPAEDGNNNICITKVLGYK